VTGAEHVAGQQIEGELKLKKIGRGLRWLPTEKSNTTTNQKHAQAMKDIGKEV
jgi:hypothetical protein